MASSAPIDALQHDTAARIPAERRCNMCCVMYGGVFSMLGSLLFVGLGTAMSIYFEQRCRYCLNGVARQIMWLTLPGTLVGMTMHFFLSEAMWSSRRNSWGVAWSKAIILNSALWCGAIGCGTLLWRRVLPMTAAGRRLYHRYPISATPIDSRLMYHTNEFWTGMGYTYWLLGVVTGQTAFATSVAFTMYNKRPYLMTPPQSQYAKKCMSPWMRDRLHNMALGKISSNSQP